MSRVFVAGATGVIGVRLVPLLVRSGHTVAGMTRSAGKADGLRALGAEAVVCDVYDVDRLVQVVVGFGPGIVVHQMTELPDDVAKIRETASANARVRREGTRNLIEAARAAGAKQFLAQSVAWDVPGESGAAAKDLERMVLDFGGVVLRYGQFYGPGTYFEDALPDPPRIHIDVAARRTVELLDAPSGIVTVAEEERA